MSMGQENKFIHRNHQGIGPDIVENPDHEKIINMILAETMTEAKLEGEALDAILAQIDVASNLQ
jgi:hypothetical protein